MLLAVVMTLTAGASELWVDPLVAGTSASFTTDGMAGSGYLVYSTAGPGSACPAALGGVCLDVASPGLLTTTTGSFSATMPPVVGTTVWFQTAESGIGSSNAVHTVVGDDAWELGDDTVDFSGSGRWRGNSFTVDSPLRLYDIGMFLDLDTDCDLTWEIWRDSGAGWTLDWTHTTSAVAGYGYHHGPVDGGFLAGPGEELMAGVGWEGCTVGYERANDDTSGTSYGGLTFNAWAFSNDWPATDPEPDDASSWESGLAYHQTIVTD